MRNLIIDRMAPISLSPRFTKHTPAFSSAQPTMGTLLSSSLAMKCMKVSLPNEAATSMGSIMLEWLPHTTAGPSGIFSRPLKLSG